MNSKIVTGNFSTRKPNSKCIHTMGNKTYDLYNPPLPKEGRDTVQAIYTDSVKDLLVPSRLPREVPKVFTKDEFDRLKKQAKVLTQKERMAIIQEGDKKRLAKEEESHMRKETLKKAQQDQKMKAGTKLSELESEAKKKTFYLLQRAFDLRQEQEDEVKKANQLILASKCLAIRSAQVVEKDLIAKEMDEEEKRLEQMIEEQRRLSLQEEEQTRMKEKKKRQRFVNEMMQQIHEKEIEKLQEGERVEEEARMQNRALIQMQRDEDEKRKLKLKEQEKMRSDLVQANKEIAKYRQVEREEQRISDLRVQEYMRKKAEREKAHEDEIEAQRQAKEKESARLRAMQEKSQDQQAARDEMNAIRIQEEVEREWRRKEKETAERKQQNEDDLRVARERQIEDIRKQQAIELEREKRDFFKIVKVQKTLRQIDDDKEQKRKIENEKHRKAILSQVNDKERERIELKKEKFDEGVAIRAEQELRDRYINAALKSKMTKLRINKVPETVVRDIERQLKL